MVRIYELSYVFADLAESAVASYALTATCAGPGRGGVNTRWLEVFVANASTWSLCLIPSRSPLPLLRTLANSRPRRRRHCRRPRPPLSQPLPTPSSASSVSSFMSSSSSSRSALHGRSVAVPLIGCPDCGEQVRFYRSSTDEHDGWIFYKCVNHHVSASSVDSCHVNSL